MSRNGGISECAKAPQGVELDRFARWIATPLCTLLVLLPGGTAQAQKLLFQPELFVGASYTDNALLLGPKDEENETLIYRAGAIFPLTRTYPGGRFTFSYAPIYERFEDFHELNYLNHRAELGLTGKPSERSNVGLHAGYSRLQDDRRSILKEPILFLRKPLTRELAAADLSFGRKFGERWNWKGGVGFSDLSFEAIEEDAPEEPPTDPPEEPPTEVPEDRQEARARMGLSWSVGPGFTVGGQYAVRRFDLEVSGEETTHFASFTIDSRVKNRYRASFGAGAFRTEGDPDDPEDLEDPEESETGAQGWLILSRAYGQNTRKNTLSLTLTHRPTLGGSQPGTAELSTAALGVDGWADDVWRWGLFGRYARRDPRLPLVTVLESYGADGYIERIIGKVVGIRLGAGYAEQTAEDPAQEGEVFRGNLTLVLYPLGRTELGGDKPVVSDDVPGESNLR